MWFSKLGFRGASCFHPTSCHNVSPNGLNMYFIRCAPSQSILPPCMAIPLPNCFISHTQIYIEELHHCGILFYSHWPPSPLSSGKITAKFMSALCACWILSECVSRFSVRFSLSDKNEEGPLVYALPGTTRYRPFFGFIRTIPFISSGNLEHTESGPKCLFVILLLRMRIWNKRKTYFNLRQIFFYMQSMETTVWQFTVSVHLRIIWSVRSSSIYFVPNKPQITEQ